MPLHIAIVTETYPPEVNGVAMTVGRLVDGMRERGHHLQIVRPAQTGEAVAAADDGLRVRGLPLPRYPGLRFGLPAARRLGRHWQRQRPDLVHVVTEGPLGWSAVQAARRLGIPVTSGFHTHFDSYSAHYGFGWLRPLVSAYLRSLHRRTRATLVPTEALAATLAGEGVAGVRVVGRGVDTTLFDPAHRDPSLRAEWGAAGGGPVGLYVGRLAPEKNLALAERAFAALREVCPGARMVWVGDGPELARLRAEHPDHVFAGMRHGADLARHYASADLFLFPSLTETYGNVVAEALASGLPVLAYRCAAAAELVGDGICGALAAPGDEAAFLRAARGLGERHGEFADMGRRARAAVLPRSWARTVALFEAVLAEAAQV